MGTKIRPELNAKNKYWISKHRYYELKHFCLQYLDFKARLNDMNDAGIYGSFIRMQKNHRTHDDPTFNLVVLREEYIAKTKIIEECSEAADRDLKDYILKSVTESVPFHYLTNVMGMPASKTLFYDRYRKFFWLLDKRLKIQVTE